MSKEIISILSRAIEQRDALANTTEACRLFNGFYEGCPGLVLDRYGTALVIFDHNQPGNLEGITNQVIDYALKNLKGIKSILLKQRQHPDEHIRKGKLIYGDSLPGKISEFGITYAIDLQMNQDASFYLDTRGLRQWLHQHMNGLRVLNAFAYTGSLGVAAGAGGAREVLQTDINRSFLAIARRSWEQNGLAEEGVKQLQGDFFRVAGRLRHQNQLFDCAILDPPFFSTTDSGTVDLQTDVSRLINKIRPLVAHEGWLVVINNALFLAGTDFMAQLDALCQSPYLEFAGIMPVPTDITGYPTTIIDQPPIDPAPFNHPTKIALLRVFRKDKSK